MKTTYQYVVLRLAVDQIRGEVINVGIVLFEGEALPRVILMATLNKLRAIDATWSIERLEKWTANIEKIVSTYGGVAQRILALERFGFCESDAIGMFHAEDAAQLAKHIASIKTKYVSNKAKDVLMSKRAKRTRLQTALRDQFKRMQILGNEVADIAEHLVVPNVPVPGYEELKTDFVYKNGVYRITQTLDYNVAPDSLHNKLNEACVKSMAADMATKTYGDQTLRFAVVDVPNEFAGAADSHIDLLIARGFEVFHFDDPANMKAYLDKAAPSIQASRPS